MRRALWRRACGNAGKLELWIVITLVTSSAVIWGLLYSTSICSELRYSQLFDWPKAVQKWQSLANKRSENASNWVEYCLNLLLLIV